MDKISHEQIQMLLTEAPTVLRKLAEERDFYKEKAACLERRDHAEKVAFAMHNKGIDTDVAFEDLVTRLEKVAEQGKLEEWERSVEMVGPNMGVKTASVSDETVSTSSSDFERYIMGNVG